MPLRIPTLPKAGSSALSDLSMADKLMMVSAILKGDRQTAMQIPLLAAQRRQLDQRSEAELGVRRMFEGEPDVRFTPPAEAASEPPAPDPVEQMSRSLGEAGGLPPIPMRSGPSVDTTPARVPMVSFRGGGIPSLSDPQAMGRLMAAKLAGARNADMALDVAKANQPDAVVVNGRVLNKRDPDIYGKFFSEAPTKGSTPAFDQEGRQIGWVLENGTLQAIQSTREAETLGETGGKFVEVPMADGTTRMMLGRDAISQIGGRGGRGSGEGFGVKPSKAQEEYATGKAKTQVEVEALTPKARSALDALDRKTDFVLEKLREAKGKVRGGLGGSTGLNALAANIPTTAAFDLDTVLDTIAANVGFDELSEMRQNSPTGGAVGNLTERELALLSSLKGSLKQGQSAEQLTGNIDRMIQELEKVRDERRAAFTRQYGGGQGAGSATTITPEQARAELARRRAARGQ